MTTSTVNLESLSSDVAAELQQFLADADLEASLHLVFAEGIHQQLATDLIQDFVRVEVPPE